MGDEDSEEKSKVPPIYLCDYDIGSWHGPAPWSIYDFSTELLEFKGVETFEQKVGPFLVHANASRYLSDIIRIDRDTIEKR